MSITVVYYDKEAIYIELLVLIKKEGILKYGGEVIGNDAVSTKYAYCSSGSMLLAWDNVFRTAFSKA